MFNQLFRYFLSGLAILIPIWGTFYILYHLIIWIDDLLSINIPGLGLLIVFVIVTNIGLLAKIFIGKSMIVFLDRFMGKIPVVAVLYKGFKEVTEALMGDQKKFDKPVLVTFSEGAVYRLGFMTQQTVNLAGVSSLPLVAVYFPHSYNFSGNVYLVNPEKIKPLDVRSGDMMKFIVSGGVVDEIQSKILIKKKT